jgi:hypothetical protein
MKTNKQNIQKKLKSYSALAGTLAAAIGSADAQVVYTDVSPDSTLSTGESYNLDLNNDAVVDFQLLQRSGSYYSGAIIYDGVGAFAMSANNAIDTTGAQGSASALDAGVRIDSTMSWVDSAAAASITPVPTANGLGFVASGLFSYSGGYFLGQTGKFLPLRFDVTTGPDAGRYYGWVRLSVAADAKSFTVIDYAYTHYLNSYSITGAVVGISEHAKQDQVNIFAYDKNITIALDPAVTPEGTIVITNLSGQKISETAISGSETIIPMQEAKTGIYMVTIKQSDGSYTKRVFLK